jgi:hypothetical protein
MAKYTVEEYRDFAYRALLDLVTTEHAAVWDEIEAKVADRQWPSAPCRLNPHHLTTARHRLGKDGDQLIVEQHDPSKGGHLVTTLQPSDQTDRLNAVRVAARRKRALQSRYVAWTQGNEAIRPRIGAAGEHAVHASLIEAAPYGYALMQPHGGEVRRLFGEPVPGGPLDNCAWLTVPGDAGRPASYLTLVEVKNVRSWIYPTAEELYQLLDKAARLKVQDPELPIVPLLICRRSHSTAGKMAKQLGFMILDMDAQPISWPVDDDLRLLTEVRDELAYDLLPVPTDRHAVPALPRLVGGLTRALPSIAERTAQTWTTIGSKLGEHYRRIRLAPAREGRAALVDQLRAAASGLGAQGGW